LKAINSAVNILRCDLVDWLLAEGEVAIEKARVVPHGTRLVLALTDREEEGFRFVKGRGSFGFGDTRFLFRKDGFCLRAHRRGFQRRSVRAHSIIADPIQSASSRLSTNGLTKFWFAPADYPIYRMRSGHWPMSYAQKLVTEGIRRRIVGVLESMVRIVLIWCRRNTFLTSSWRRSLNRLALKMPIRSRRASIAADALILPDRENPDGWDFLQRQALQKDAPLQREIQRTGNITAIRILGGLHHECVQK
jgi:hypothetical protein